MQALEEFFNAFPSSRQALDQAKKLGIWTSSGHSAIPEKRDWPRQFSALSDDALSDANSLWSHEAARVTELVGFLESQKLSAVLKHKTAKAAARMRVRSSLDKGTAAEIDDRASSDPGLLTADESLIKVEVLLTQAKAYKEAAILVLSSISREISFRQAQYNAKIRA